MSATNYLEEKLLKAALTGVSYSNGTTYLALYSTAPTDSTSGTELSGNGYSRQAITFTVSGGSATTAYGATFTASGGDWSKAVAAAIVDASTGGNILFYKNLVSPKTNKNGESITFNEADISILLD